MYERRRNIVTRPDGRRVNVARFRGQLFVCATGCCCGRTEDGFAPVPGEAFHREWERRRLRNLVHLTIGGCLGPCALANVALLLFDGQAQWFHSVNSDAMARAIYDHVEAMLEADRCLPPPAALAPYHFTGSAWQPRPDGRPVDDVRPRRAGAPAAACAGMPSGVSADGRSLSVERVVAVMEGHAALPRKNGELVFDEPWQGRAFGMAVALHEGGAYDWEEFRQEL
ncbi:MAG TPA: cobalt chelatase, partial [Vicinamibacteria bacterium]|nr:cobalt chelatase [Vicinamibacteria bacterium]